MTAEIGGKVILLYQQDEDMAESTRQILSEHGIVAIACKNPNNFRFVVPEIVPATQVDLIGRLALQALGADKPFTAFGTSVRNALAPPSPPIPTQAKAGNK